jgi:hypothetical protein
MPPSKAKRAGKISKKQAAPSRKKVVSKPIAPAKKAPTKKAPAAAKKAPAKKAPALAKKSTAKKPLAPAKKPLTSAKKAPAKKAPAKKAPAKKAPAVVRSASVSQKATPARDALQALTQKRAIAAALSPVSDGKDVVDAYMRDVDHPFKAEMQAVREIILGASPKITERIKWNAPSFYYKEDLGAFNPRATEFAHLILLFPDGQGMDDSNRLLEGNHKDRREAKFHSLDDVKAKKRSLEKLVKAWVALRD